MVPFFRRLLKLSAPVLALLLRPQPYPQLPPTLCADGSLEKGARSPTPVPLPGVTRRARPAGTGGGREGRPGSHGTHPRATGAPGCPPGGNEWCLCLLESRIPTRGRGAAAGTPARKHLAGHQGAGWAGSTLSPVTTLLPAPVGGCHGLLLRELTLEARPARPAHSPRPLLQPGQPPSRAGKPPAPPGLSRRLALVRAPEHPRMDRCVLPAPRPSSHLTT